MWVGWLGTRLHSYQDISCGQVVIVRKSLSDMTLCYNWYLVLVVNDGSCSDQLLNNVSVAFLSSLPQRYCLFNNLWRMGGGENAVMVEWNKTTVLRKINHIKYWQRYLLLSSRQEERLLSNKWIRDKGFLWIGDRFPFKQTMSSKHKPTIATTQWEEFLSKGTP